MNLQRINPSFIVYILGAMLLGYFYSDVKQALGGKLLFLAAVIAYLLVLRYIGMLVSKKLNM